MKKLVIIALPVLILAVGAGLVLTGIVKIPGLNLKGKPKQTAKANQLYAEGKDPKVAQKKPPVKETPPKNPATQKKATPPPKVDAVATETKPELGQKKLAKLWNEIEVAALKDLTQDWKDTELAAVLNKMDSAKVAELLAVLEPKRASKLSKELQKQASIVPRETGA